MVRRLTETTGNRQLLLLLAAIVLFNAANAIFSLLFNLFMLGIGYREGAIGIVAGAQAFGSVVGTIPIGIAAHRFGVKRMLVLCLGLMASVLFARVFVHGYREQVVFAAADGILLCAWSICLMPAIASITDQSRRTSAFSFAFAFAVIGTSIGSLLGGHFLGWWRVLANRYLRVEISDLKSMQMSLLCASLLTAVSAAPILRMQAQTGSEGPKPVDWLHRPSPFLIRFLIASFLWAAAIGTINPFGNLIFVHHLGLATSRLGNFFAWSELLQAAVLLSLPLVARRLGLISSITAGQIGSAFAILALALQKNVAIAEALYFLFMSAQNFCSPAIQNLLMDGVPEDQRSGAASLNFLAVSVAQAVASAIAGTSFQRFGYPAILTAISVGLLGTGFGFRLLVRENPSSTRILVTP